MESFVISDITATIESQNNSDIWNACRMTVLLYVINCSCKLVFLEVQKVSGIHTHSLSCTCA